SARVRDDGHRNKPAFATDREKVRLSGMNILLPFLAVVAPLGVAQASPNGRATPDQLNGKHHRLAFNFHAMGEAPAPWTHFMVGAQLEVRVSHTLGQGHGPFYDVYARTPPIPRPVDGLAVSLKHTGYNPEETLLVTCQRAGAFELAVDATDLDGKPITD